MHPVDIDPTESARIWRAVLDYRHDHFGEERQVELRGVDRYPVPEGGCDSLERAERAATSLSELLRNLRAPKRCGLVIEIGSPGLYYGYRVEKIDQAWRVTKSWRSRPPCSFGRPRSRGVLVDDLETA